MKPQLIEHLDKARDTVTEVDQIVSSRDYPCDIRTVMVRGLLSTMIEHHRSLLQLIKSAAVGSSLALARDIIKGLRYGLWINACATPEQILQIKETDEFPLSFPEMIKEIDAAYNADTFFEGLKNRWGSQLYRYSRSEIVRLGQWHIDSRFGLAHDDEEIRDLTTTATLCIVLLAAEFLARQDYGVECKRVEALGAITSSSSHS
jgi:hypothetical protein